MHQAGIAQLVERQPSKLNVAGSNPVSRSIAAKCYGPHSSVVEHFLGKEEVTGSIPVVGSIRILWGLLREETYLNEKLDSNVKNRETFNYKST